MRSLRFVHLPLRALEEHVEDVVGLDTRAPCLLVPRDPLGASVWVCPVRPRALGPTWATIEEPMNGLLEPKEGLSTVCAPEVEALAMKTKPFGPVVHAHFIKVWF